jgi:hypothetical protein
MYENVVFAILALCFIILSQRPSKRKIPLLTIVYRAGFIFSLGMAVISSYSVQQTYTTFSYNVSGIYTANSIYSYSNLITGQANNQAIIIVFVIMMIAAIVVEIVEDTLNATEEMGRRLK